MYDMILESSKQRSQRINVRLHDVEHIKKMSKKARTVYGGGNNVKGPHKSKSSANTNSIKSSSLFIAAMLLVGCFFWIPRLQATDGYMICQQYSIDFYHIHVATSENDRSVIIVIVVKELVSQMSRLVSRSIPIRHIASK